MKNTYKYSPITKITVKDFRNIGFAELSFEHSPIISLVGDNEAGKTSIVKAFAVCACHAYVGEQKDFIRTGQSRFCIGITLENGTAIARVKGDVENRYTVALQDGRVWNLTKLPVGEGTPVVVQDAMGIVCEPETKEFLHIRTYEDKLLFAATPNSTNHKMMYNALKVDNLSKAVRAGSQEINLLKRSIYEDSIQTITFQKQVDGYIDKDLSNVIPLKARVKRQLDLLDKLEAALSMKREIDAAVDKLGKLALLDDSNLHSIDEMIAVSLNRVSSLMQSIMYASRISHIYSNMDGLTNIDEGVLTKLVDTCKNVREVERLKERGGIYGDIPKLCEVDVNLLSRLTQMLGQKIEVEDRTEKLSKLKGLIEKTPDISMAQVEVVTKMSALKDAAIEIIGKRKEMSQATSYADGIETYFKQQGVCVETCPNCGESVVIAGSMLG